MSMKVRSKDLITCTIILLVILQSGGLRSLTDFSGSLKARNISSGTLSFLLITSSSREPPHSCRDFSIRIAKSK